MKTKRVLLHIVILALAIVSIASGSYGIYHTRYYESKEKCLERYSHTYAMNVPGIIEQILCNRTYRANFMDSNKVVAKGHNLKTITIADVIKVANTEEKLSFYKVMTENTKAELEDNSSNRKKEEYNYYRKVLNKANLYLETIKECENLRYVSRKSKDKREKALTTASANIFSDDVEFQATYVLNGKTYELTNQNKKQEISKENNYLDIVTATADETKINSKDYLQEEEFIKAVPQYLEEKNFESRELTNSKFTLKMGLKKSNNPTSYWLTLAKKADNSMSEKQIAKQRTQTIICFAICGACMILSLIPFIMLLIMAGHKRKGDIPYTNKFDKVWADALAVLMVIVGISMGMSICENAFQNPPSGLTGVVGYVVLCGFFCLIYIEVFIQCAESFARRIKSKVLIKSTFLYWIYKKIRAIIVGFAKDGKVWRKVTVIGIIIFLWNIIALALIQDYEYWGILFGWIIPILFICKCLIRYFGEKEKIIKDAEKITEGEVEYKIYDNFKYPSNRKLKDAINNIGDGIESAVAENLKSERMKTDLITNVSHDLKTPLTSIINYVDLLKTEGVDSENANKYLDVLDKKSQRLKNLTEDLVEASKLTSGAIELHKEKINIVELINQSLGEYNEKFQEKKLTVVKNIPSRAIYINADGRRMWRVFENLYGNIYKYAMENTRVYVDVKEENKTVHISIKNISEKPLNISADELMERFVRGDQSRTTEGSGLGLSIAQTIIERHDGTMEIILDGDLFKVAIAIK